MNKEHVRAQLMERIHQQGISQNEAAARIGVSAATLTNIKNRKWENITGAWDKVRRWLGGSGSWQLVETRNFKKVRNLCAHAQSLGITHAVSFDQGTGKSTSAKEYVKEHKNAFYLECESYWTKREFLRNLCSVMGLVNSGSIARMMEAIIGKLNKTNKPLVVLDEFDQVSDKILVLYKSLFNKTDAGFVLIGGIYFDKRMKRGVRGVRQSYLETYSRMGGKLEQLYKITPFEIDSICGANGVFDADFKPIGGDLRALKLLIQEYKLNQQKRGQS